MPPYRLIGSPVSLYTGKARAYLRFKKLSFEEVLATREVYKGLILPRTGVRYIPVLITPQDEAIQDTTEIMDTLEARHPDPSVVPEGPVQQLVSLLFEVYGDEWLVIPAMHYRWSFEENRQFAVAEFGRTSAPDRTPEEQLRIGQELSGPFAGALPFLGVTAQTGPAVERSYEAFLSDFDRHLQTHDYLLGARPCVGDFGLIGPLYAHLYRDPYSGSLMRRLAPRVAAWVERMHQPPEAVGEFCADDEVPTTLEPLLRRMFVEQVPVLRDTAAALGRWVEAQGAEPPEVPRGLGMGDFAIEGVEGTRARAPYALWMWQRPCDHWAALDAPARGRATALLSGIDAACQALSESPPCRVERRNNRLHIQASGGP